jgi:hypothetical protein
VFKHTGRFFFEMAIAPRKAFNELNIILSALPYSGFNGLNAEGDREIALATELVEHQPKGVCID